MGNPRNANGHRRRELTGRLLATGAQCAWPECPWPGDHLGSALRQQIKQARPSDYWLDERYPVVDEVIPIAFGGSPTSRANTRLLHRWCNSRRGAGREPATPTPPIIASPGW